MSSRSAQRSVTATPMEIQTQQASPKKNSKSQGLRPAGGPVLLGVFSTGWVLCLGGHLSAGEKYTLSAAALAYGDAAEP